MNIELAKQAFDIFVNTNSKEEYEKRLKELSLKLHKTSSYLRNLRDDYYMFFASNEERAKFDFVKERNRLARIKYNIVVEDLLNLSNDDRGKYILSHKYSKSEIVNFCIVYIKNCKDKTKCKLVLDLSNWVDNFFSEKFLKENQYRKNSLLEKAFKIFNEIIKGGFYSIEDYINYSYSKYNMDKYTFGHDIMLSKAYLKSHDRDSYDFFVSEMEKNRVRMFNLYEENIKNFILMLQSHDIVDYYLMFGMPIVNFRKMCKGFIDSDEEASLNIFFSKYVETDSSIVDESKLLNSNYLINNEFVTDKEKNIVLDFMKQKNIPNPYFYIVLKKYLNGNLKIENKKTQM